MTQIALITGANRNIGLETARQLARDHGFTVLIGARDSSSGETAAQELRNEGLNARFLPLDVTDAKSIEAAARVVSQEFAHLDVLINNAAINYDLWQTASGADLRLSRETMETNLFGAWATILAFLPLLRRSERGRIINVSSEAASFGASGGVGEAQFGLGSRGGAAPAYGVSKAALNALTVLLADELKNTNVTVNAVSPGFVATFPGGAEMGARPIPDGARGIAQAALREDGARGQFWRDGEPLPW